MLYLSQSCGTKHATQVTNLGNVIRMKELRHAICYLHNKKTETFPRIIISKPMSQLICNFRKYFGITTVFSSVGKGGRGGGNDRHGLKLEKPGRT